MQFDARPDRPASEASIVPMINVVFLLLVFFLLASQIAPPEPVEVTPPVSAEGADPESELRLYLDAGGAVHFRELSGPPALAAALAEGSGSSRLIVVADRELEAVKFAALLRELGKSGLSGVELVVATE